jgi:hypothetical protein
VKDTTTIGFKDDQFAVSLDKNVQFFLDEYQGYAGGYKL